MVALADGAALTATAAPERAAEVLTTISTTGREALDEMHRLLGLLRDASDRSGLAPQPGLDDLDQLVTQVRDAGLRATLVREGTPGPWGPGAGLTVYRLIQEALTNTLKHAGPSATARIRLRYRKNGVELEIVDDGAGPRTGRADGGHGLAGMIERVAAYDGRVDAGPLPAGGWRVHATLHFGQPGEPS
jgi:signal transduction histidine kinase